MFEGLSGFGQILVSVFIIKRYISERNMISPWFLSLLRMVCSSGVSRYFLKILTALETSWDKRKGTLFGV